MSKPLPANRTLWEMRDEMARLVSWGKGDPEAAHSRADYLLIEALRMMTRLVGGDPTLWPREVEELIESWNEVEKWYA
jgi:hypothetical protein